MQLVWGGHRCTWAVDPVDNHLADHPSIATRAQRPGDAAPLPLRLLRDWPEMKFPADLQSGHCSRNATSLN